MSSGAKPNSAVLHAQSAVLMARETLQIHPTDNVFVALAPLHAGKTVRSAEETFTVRTGVPAQHKVAARAIGKGEVVTMYGVCVGRAVTPIGQGEALTTKNISHDSAPFYVRSCAYAWEPPDVNPWRDRHFMGYHRSDGQVGTANHWIVLPLVFCENRNVSVLKAAFEQELGYAIASPYRNQVAELARLYRAGASPDALREHRREVEEERQGGQLFGQIGGIHFLTHEGGCGGTRQDARSLCGLFASYLHHPNVAGATVLSLGCENAQIDLLKEEIGQRNPDFDKPLLIYRQQSYSSAHALLTAAIRDTFAALTQANGVERRPAPLGSLTVGLECGGSDGFSGLSANPAMGHMSDLLVALGGRAILAEFPELCGVEQALIDRCASSADAERFAGLMQAYAALAASVGSGFDMNPSAGNIRDGLLTDAMKSAGAARKGGSSPVTGVLDYPEYATSPGLNLLCTPGGDVESTTALAGAGAQIILFSTGLGTPTGNPIASVVKISSNTELFRRLPDLIDVDAGGIITGRATIEEVGASLLDTVIDVANGAKTTKATRLRQHDFIPWKRGVSL